MADRKPRAPKKAPPEVLSPLKEKPKPASGPKGGRTTEAKVAKTPVKQGKEPGRAAPARKAKTPKIEKPAAEKRRTKPKPKPAPEKDITLSGTAINVVRLMAQSGASIKDVAAYLDVDVPTVGRIYERHPEILQSPASDTAEAANVGGRPPVWDERNIVIARTLASLGATDLEISQAFEVSLRTIHRWKLDHPEFREALVQGKEVIDAKVEESLLKRALGYTFDSEKIMVVDKELQRVETVEHVPPDTKAAMWWLQNRRPGLWRDTKHIKHDVEADSELGGWLKEISGRAMKPVDQDGPATSNTPTGAKAFGPASDGQEPGTDV